MRSKAKTNRAPPRLQQHGASPHDERCRQASNKREVRKNEQRVRRGASDHGHFEVTAVTEGAWRVGDLRVPEEDPLHVVAFVESRDERLEVVWLRGSSAVTDLFDSLDSALDAIDDILTTGEVRNVSAAAATHPGGR